MKTRTDRILQISFIITVVVFILVVGLKVYKSFNFKKELNEIKTLNDNELTAKLINYLYIFDTPYSEKELAKYTPEEQLKLIGDDYSQYLTIDEFEQRDNVQNLRIMGLGFKSLQIEDGYFEVVEVLQNSPVEEAGLIPGDKITKIKGKSIKDMDTIEAMKLIEENDEKAIELTIQRDTDIFDVSLTRKLIKRNPVISKMLEDDIGYMRLTLFSYDLGQQFINELTSLLSKNMKKLVIDLRGNTGGDVHSIIPIASSLLDNSIDKLFTITYKHTETEKYTRAGDMLFSGPLVVLCDNYTASASELLISILKDYNRCTTVGKKTYGKQVSQDVFKLNSGNTLILTTGLCLPPNEEVFNKKGISPDFDISLDKDLKDTQLSKAIEILKESR